MGIWSRSRHISQNTQHASSRTVHHARAAALANVVNTLTVRNVGLWGGEKPRIRSRTAREWERERERSTQARTDAWG